MTVEIEPELAAALAALILHLAGDEPNTGAGRSTSSAWSDDHRRRLMGRPGRRERMQSRTAWR